MNSSLTYDSLFNHPQTFLTKVLAHHFRSAHGKKVLLSATTGAAARRLSHSASTVHNSFVIPTKGFIRQLRHDNVMRDVMKQSDVFFIDEMSMMTADTLSNVLNRLMQIKGCRSIKSLLEKILLILVGDHAQVRLTLCSLSSFIID